MILFKTEHGSRLYGLHHANSDYDYYTVISKKKRLRARYARQTIANGEDNLVIDFGTWLQLCTKGVPQALEAMFARHPVIDNISAFRAGFRVGPPVWKTYIRTIDNFLSSKDIKRTRHALRLAINLSDIRKYGYFNPTLNRNQIVMINSLIHLDTDELRDVAHDIAFRIDH